MVTVIWGVNVINFLFKVSWLCWLNRRFCLSKMGPQSQPASAKLGYSFEELCFWRFKLKFLSGSTIDFLLYARQLISESPRKGTLLLYCRYRFSGLRAPAARPTSGVFHGLEPMKKRMICSTSILNVRRLLSGVRARSFTFRRQFATKWYVLIVFFVYCLWFQVGCCSFVT